MCKGLSGHPLLNPLLPTGCRMPGLPPATIPTTLRVQGALTGTRGPGWLRTREEISYLGRGCPDLATVATGQADAP